MADEDSTVRIGGDVQTSRHLKTHNLMDSTEESASKDAEQSHLVIVEYRKKELDFAEFEQIRTLLLHKCQEIISNTANPFLKKNLTTAKVFKDILEYHRSTHPKPAKLAMVTKKKANQSHEGAQFKRNLAAELATGDQITIL